MKPKRFLLITLASTTLLLALSFHWRWLLLPTGQPIPVPVIQRS